VAWPFLVIALVATVLALDVAPALAWLLALGAVLTGIVGIPLVLRAGRRAAVVPRERDVPPVDTGA
jgi:hypothetical protein